MTPGRAGLVAGLVLGVGMTAWGLTAPPDAPLPPGAVALVGEAAILEEDYERALSAFAADRRGALTDGDRRRVLDRLIDEQLLVQRGLELGLVARDVRLRSGVSAAMLDLLRRRAEEQPPPTDEALRAYHASHPERFRSGGQVRLETAFFLAEARGREAASSGDLEGAAPFALAPPQGALVPLALVAQRLGPTVARGVAELDVGAVGGPWRSQGGWHVARLLERRGGELQPFDASVDAVRRAVDEEAQDALLRDFLEERRRLTPITVR